MRRRGREHDDLPARSREWKDFPMFPRRWFRTLANTER